MIVKKFSYDKELKEYYLIISCKGLLLDNDIYDFEIYAFFKKSHKNEVEFILNGIFKNGKKIDYCDINKEEDYIKEKIDDKLSKISIDFKDNIEKIEKIYNEDFVLKLMDDKKTKINYLEQYKKYQIKNLLFENYYCVEILYDKKEGITSLELETIFLEKSYKIDINKFNLRNEKIETFYKKFEKDIKESKKLRFKLLI